MNAMSTRLRRLIALSIAAVILIGLAYSAQAAKSIDHSAVSSITLSKTGFLSFKSFLIGPSDRDEPGIALESMRIISPATIFSAPKGYSPSLLPPELFAPLKRKPMPVKKDIDSLTIKVKGAPVTLSLGLKDALSKDLRDNIDQYGVSGLTNPATGFASAAYLRSATNDVLKQIDQLEGLHSKPALQRSGAIAPYKIVLPQEPPTILIFLTGLLFVVLLRGDRLQPKTER